MFVTEEGAAGLQGFAAFATIDSLEYPARERCASNIHAFIRRTRAEEMIER
jgi:hypothetical protein